MAEIDELLAALDEREMARAVALRHDEARMAYPLRRNTVDNFDEFTDAIGDYYNYHFTRCVSGGGALSRAEAAGRAKEILDQEYRHPRRGGDIVMAFNDASDGTNGGLRVILDTIAEALKAEAVERYVRDQFDRYVAPNDWEQKVEIIRQFIDRHGASLASSIRADQPERYAQNYQELIRRYVEALRQSSSVFRRF